MTTPPTWLVAVGVIFVFGIAASSDAAQAAESLSDNAMETGEVLIVPEPSQQPLSDAETAPAPAEPIEARLEEPIAEDDPNTVGLADPAVDETHETPPGVADVPGPAEEAPSAIGDPIPVDNGATAFVRSCEWDTYAATPYPSCYVDVTPPDEAPGTYTVNLRDIEATPAFIDLGADLTEWFWLWERTEGAQLSFTTDGTQASSGAKLDMGRVPPIIEPGEPIQWSCFSDVPAPPGVEYDRPEAPAPFAGSAIVGQPLTIALGDLVKDSVWQTALMTPDTPLVLDGPAADGSFTWTPDTPGEYTFDYHLGTSNCVLGALTGSIHVAAPGITIDVPTQAPSEPFVVSPQPATLAETGVSPSRWHVAGLGGIALTLGAIIAALGQRRGRRSRVESIR